MIYARIEVNDYLRPTFILQMQTIFIKDIIKSKTEWIHFLFFFIIGVSLSAFLYVLVIPLMYWSIYGSGASSDEDVNLPVHVFIMEWGALIVVLLMSLSGIYINIKQQDLRRTKSHLLTAFIVTVLYLFRLPILTILFRVFQ